MLPAALASMYSFCMLFRPSSSTIWLLMTPGGSLGGLGFAVGISSGRLSVVLSFLRSSDSSSLCSGGGRFAGAAAFVVSGSGTP